MTIQAIEFLPPPSGLELPGAQAAGKTGSDFSAWFDQEFTRVNDQLQQADDLVRKLALGEVDNVHQVMVALDRARTSFQLLAQVRNKLLEGYQDILRMSV